MSITTCEVVAPFVTSFTVPFRILRALIFMTISFNRYARIYITASGQPAAPPFVTRSFRGGAVKQRRQLLVAEVEMVEQVVEVARLLSEVDLRLLRVECLDQPVQADQPVDARGRVDPAERQGGGA